MSSVGSKQPGHLPCTPFPPPGHFASRTHWPHVYPLGGGGRGCPWEKQGWAGEGRRGKQKLRCWRCRFRKLINRPGSAGRGEVRAPRAASAQGLWPPRSCHGRPRAPGQLQGFCTALPAPARKGGEPEVTPRLSPLSQTAADHRGPGKPSQ